MKYILAIIIIGGAIIGYVYFKKAPEKVIVYTPYAVLCSGEYEYFVPGESQCFSISREGKEIASTSVTMGLKFFGDITSTTNFAKLADAIDNISLETEIKAVSIVEDNEYIIHSKIGKILLKGNDLEAELGNVIVFLKDKKNKVYEYIDARHGNSIFYK